METEVSLPWSLLVSIPIQSHRVHTSPPYFCNIHFNILPSTSWSSKWFLSFWISDQNFVCISHLSHAWYILRHLGLLDLIALILLIEDNRFTKLFSVRFSPGSRHFLPLRSRCSQRQHLQSVFFPCDRPSSILTQCNRKIYSFVDCILNFSFSERRCERQKKILNWMGAVIPRI